MPQNRVSDTITFVTQNTLEIYDDQMFFLMRNEN